MIYSFFHALSHLGQASSSEPTTPGPSQTGSESQNSNVDFEDDLNHPSNASQHQVELPLPNLTGQYFPTISAFKQFVNEYCRSNNPGYALVTTRSRKWSATLQCSRHGLQVNRRKHKCGCMFRVEGTFSRETLAFEFKIVVPYHNHDATGLVLLPYLRAPKVWEIERDEALTTSIIISPTSVAKAAIRHATGCTAVTTKDVLNIRKCLRQRQRALQGQDY